MTNASNETQLHMLPGKSYYTDAMEAIADMKSGDMLAVGGFSTVKNRALTLLDALSKRTDVTNLTVVANSFPHQPLAENNQVSKFIGAFGGSVYRRAGGSEARIRSGEMAFEPSPQGIFTERLRAGAAGIPAFFSPVGVDTLVAEGKERRTIDGKDYILETALRPDFGFIRADKADTNGNVSGLGSTLNFHPVIAAASKVTIVEVEELVPAGSIAPEDVTIPGIYVDRIVLHNSEMGNEAWARERTTNTRIREADDKPGLPPELMALRVAQMLKAGQYVNLGMGLPTTVANFIEPEREVQFHAENGLLGYGRRPGYDDPDYLWYYFNAQGQAVTLQPGAAVFDSFAAFTMARGGHIDVVVLGGMQVSASGDLANWWAPFMAAGGMGGAMDLCTNVPELIILMEHTLKDGEKKILNQCTYPLTAKGVVTKIVTDLAVIEVTPAGLVLKEVAPGVTPEYVQERTEPQLIVAPDCKEMEFTDSMTTAASA